MLGIWGGLGVFLWDPCVGEGGGRERKRGEIIREGLHD